MLTKLLLSCVTPKNSIRATIADNQTSHAVTPSKKNGDLSICSVVIAKFSIFTKNKSKPNTKNKIKLIKIVNCFACMDVFDIVYIKYRVNKTKTKFTNGLAAKLKPINEKIKNMADINAIGRTNVLIELTIVSCNL